MKANKLIRITEDDIHQMVRDALDRLSNQPEDSLYLCEGINLTRKGNQGFISFDPYHERLVNTSIIDNPTVDTNLIPNVEVWSIFQRDRDGINKYDIRRDGNPLIYAFKNNENGCFFESPRDKEEILRHMKIILGKFHKAHPFGTTIMIPSKSDLNTLLANMYLDINSDADIIKGILLKMTTNEVFNELDKPDSEFSKFYGDNIEYALDKLCDYLEIMDKNNDGIFSYHMVSNDEMRNHIETTLKLCPNPSGAYGERINGKDILIIDDSVSRGKILMQAVNLIQNNFLPHSITVLTLFSRI